LSYEPGVSRRRAEIALWRAVALGVKVRAWRGGGEIVASAEAGIAAFEISVWRGEAMRAR